HAGLRVRDAVVLIDREQGAAARLEAMGVRMHPILSLEVVLTFLRSTGHIKEEDYQRSLAYLRREGEARSEYDYQSVPQRVLLPRRSVRYFGSPAGRPQRVWKRPPAQRASILG